MKKTIIFIIILIMVVAGIYLIVSNNQSTNQVNTNQTNTNPINILPGPVNTSPNTAVPQPSNAAVSIKNFSFSPQTLKIKVGTKVTWTNDDSVSHTVTSDSGNLLDSPTLSPGESFSFTFTSLGSASYHCNIHKMMKGTIVVE